MPLEVIQKLQDLVTELENKNAATQVLNDQLSAKKLALSDVERRQLAAANQLSARERVVGKLEDLEKGKADLAEKSKKHQEDRTKLAERIVENSKKSKELDEAIKSANDKEALYCKKRDALHIKEAEIDRKNKVRQEILAELRKGL